MSAAIAAAIAGPLIGGLMGSGASSSAADTQAQAAQQANQTQLQMFNQVQKNLAPWMRSGQNANSLLNAFLGLPTQTQSYDQIYQGLLPQFTTTQKAATSAPSTPQFPGQQGYVTVYNGTGSDGDTGTSVPISSLMGPSVSSGPTTSVDYAGLNAAVQNQLAQQNQLSAAVAPIQGMGLKPFSYNEATDPMAQTMLQFGSDAIANQRSAMGGVNSGATLKALSDYGQKTAASSYQQEYNNYYNQLNQIYNMLSGVSGSGQNAAAGVGNAGMSAANNISSNQIGTGNAQAAGIMGSVNALSGGLSSLSSLPYLMNQNGGASYGGVPNSTLNAVNQSSDPIGSLITSMNW